MVPDGGGSLKFRFGITAKLIAMLLATSLVLVVVMALATRWAFTHGFQEYLAETEVEQLDQARQELAQAFKQHGSWQFIERKHHLWARYILGEDEGPAHRPAGRGPEGPNGFAPPPPRRFPDGSLLPPPGPKDRAGLLSRLRLLDARQNVVIGAPSLPDDEVILKEIEIGDETIGWLSLTAPPISESGVADAFSHEQLEALYPIGLGALLMALIVGIPLGRHMLKPVSRLAEGAHALARGEYSSRVEVTGRDELSELAQDFNLLADALDRNEKLRRQGMADVSHELRTPIALIRGEVEAMQDGIRPLDQQQLVKLHHTVMQLNRLVDDLYQLALVDAGALNYSNDDIDFAEIVTEAAEAMEGTLNRLDLAVDLSVEPELPIFGDERRLRQVIDNLLKNSGRYTDAGGQVVVIARRVDTRVQLIVEDSAPGMEQGRHQHMFDRFYRAESSRNRASGGAGLGLAICSSIVSAHQGTISASASELGGVRILVELPLRG